MGTQAQSARPRGRKPKDPQEVLDALELLLREKPLHELGIEEILTAAGVSRATFYLHYPTKHAAAIALFNRVLGEITASMATFVARDEGTAVIEALREGVHNSTATWFQHRVILETVVQNAHVVPEFAATLRAMKSEFSRAIAREIERERRAGLAPPGLPEKPLCAALVECTLHLLYSAGVGDTKDLPAPRSIEHSIFALWCGTVYHIAPPEASR